MPKKPETPDEWRAHATDLHGQGLESIDIIRRAGDLPAESASAHALYAQSLFLAAQSAVAMAGHLATLDSRQY